MRRSRFVLAFCGLVALAIAFAAFTTPTPAPTAAAPAPGARTVTIDPGPLTPGDHATVRWTGFNQGSAYLYVCEVRPEQTVPHPTQCFGDTVVIAETGPNGKGEAEVEVRSALYPVTLYSGTGETVIPGGASAADCRSVRCGIVVSECSTLLTQNTAAQVAYEVVPPTTEQYSDDPHVDIDWVFDEEFQTGYIPTFSPKPVIPESEPTEQDPVVATGLRILAAGGDLGGAVYNAWGRELAGKANLKFDISPLDYARGVDGLIDGNYDVAVSGAELTAAQRETLASKDQSLVFVPITVSTVGIGYNAFPQLPMRDLRLSAKSLAGLIDPNQQAAPNNLIDGSVGEDQGACKPSVGRSLTLYSKAGVSEANLTISGWLDESVPALWTHGRTGRLPPVQSNSQVQLSNELVVPAVLAPKAGETNTKIDLFARLGLVDTTWAKLYGAPMALIQNESERWVAPTPAGALATLRSSEISDDNIVQVDYRSTDPAAYPLVSVMYAVAPTHITDDFTAEKAKAVRSMLTYFVSGDGQRTAERFGFVPLPFDLESRANATIAKIGSVAPPVPTTATTTTTTTTIADTTTTTPATTATTTTTTATTTTTTTTARTSAPSTAPPTASPPNTSPRPSTASPSVTTPATTPSVTTTTSVEADTTIVDEDPDDVAFVPVATPTTEEPTPLPPDVFSSMFGDPPLSPNLPTLGMAGASTLVVGQGLRLWRVQQRRRPRLPA